MTCTLIGQRVISAVMLFVAQKSLRWFKLLLTFRYVVWTWFPTICTFVLGPSCSLRCTYKETAFQLSRFFYLIISSYKTLYVLGSQYYFKSIIPEIKCKDKKKRGYKHLLPQAIINGASHNDTITAYYKRDETRQETWVQVGLVLSRANHCTGGIVERIKKKKKIKPWHQLASAQVQDMKISIHVLLKIMISPCVVTTYVLTYLGNPQVFVLILPWPRYAHLTTHNLQRSQGNVQNRCPPTYLSI